MLFVKRFIVVIKIFGLNGWLLFGFVVKCKHIMKKILTIATGGTIASRQDGSGLTPEMNIDEILARVSVSDFCEPHAVQLMNVDSTNMTPERWLKIADCIRENYDRYDGFIVLHGTDTMAYTAAALSYLVQNSPKPIVITGSQKPIDRDVTDAKTNLCDAFLYCCHRCAYGVQIVFDGKVIAGTRAKKTRSKSYNAFSSINYPYKAIIQDGKVISYTRSKPKKAPVFYDKLDTSVGLFKLIPAADPRILDEYFKLCDAVIIESFGTGGVPDGEEFGFYPVIDKWRKRGKIAVMCTQVVNEGSDMTVYKVGRSLKEKYGLLESYDMTPEAVVCKLMWILALTQKRGEVKRLFYKNVCQDVLYGEK